MSAEEWELIKRIFAAALNLPESARLAYVNEACAERPDLVETINELLMNHQEASVLSACAGTTDVPVFSEGELVGSRFHVVRFIARGGMGEVYEVYDDRLRQRVALKTLRPRLVEESGALDRFQREILVARGVTHDNICRVFDYIEHQAGGSTAHKGRIVPCLTMELLEGESLSDALRRRRPIPASEALPIIRQIGAGLKTLHDRGIVHRDLKPSNIVLTRNKSGGVRAVVTDFGLAKPAAVESDLFESHVEMQGGAPFFMAPELLRGERPSVASDIYAFGMVIDEIVTITRAFAVNSPHALYYAKLWESPTAPRDRSPELPLHWNAAILRCLAANPDERYASAEAVVEALERPALLEPAVEPSPVAFKISQVISTPSSKSSRRRAVTVAAAILVGSALLGATVLSSAGAPVPTVEVFDIENRTNRPELDYVCKGTTSELMRRLALLGYARVIPLNAPRSKAPVRTPSRFSLDGALQADNGQVRLSVTFTDNEDHTLAWAEKYDREGLESPIALQTEIAEGTVAALRERLAASHSPAAVRWATRLRQAIFQSFVAGPGSAPTTNNVAFDLYMRGRHLLEEASQESAHAAIDLLKRAVEKDPKFGLAHSALADACINTMDNSLMTDPELLRIAREHAEIAVRVEPNLAEGHASLAAVRQADWDWKGSEASYREALRLKPSFARARLWYAGLIIQFGRTSEALREAQLAFEQDPYDRGTPRTYGIFLFLSRRFPEAEQLLSRMVVGREMPLARHNLGQVYAQMATLAKGDKASEYFQRAFAEAETVEAIERRANPRGELPRPSIADRMFAVFYTQAGMQDRAHPYVERVFEDVQAGRVSPVIGAWLFALQGQDARALDMLELAERNHDRRILYIKVNPYLDRLHSHPRFVNLLNRIGM